MGRCRGACDGGRNSRGGARLSILALGVLLVLSGERASAQAHHGIPDFCASPDITATTNNFTALGASADDVIVIPSGVTVTYNQNSTTRYDAICVESGGLLTFGTSGTLTLRINTLVVEEGGELRIGTEGAPFTGTAIVEFDGALKDASAADVDPGQWGLGLIVLGKIRTYGTVRTRFVRLTEEADDTETAFTLASTPTGWASGDSVMIPDSLQRNDANGNAEQPAVFQTVPLSYSERRTLSATVTDANASITAGLTYDHPCGKNTANSCVMYPHIANLSSNIIFRSVNPSGERGHTIFVHRADVDIRYALFQDLGRTTIADLDCSQRTTGASNGEADCVEGTGDWVSVGTNQKGRYAVHFHHLYGPVNVPNTGYQGTFIGNAIVDSTKWPLTVHLSNYLLIQGNAVAYFTGPGFMMEDAAEHFNLIDANFVADSDSNVPARGEDGGTSDVGAGGREAAGFWMDGGSNNYFTNNVAAAFRTDAGNIVPEICYKFHLPAGSQTVKVPNFRGADLQDADEYTLVDPRAQPFLQFEDNECYASSTALTIWHKGNDGGDNVYSGATSTLTGLVGWALWQELVYEYDYAFLTFAEFTLYGDYARKNAINGGAPMGYNTGDYRGHNVTLTDWTLNNCYWCLWLQSDTGTFTVTNLTTGGQVGVYQIGYSTPGTFQSPTGWGSGKGFGANPGSATRHYVFTNWTHTDLSAGVGRAAIFDLDYRFPIDDVSSSGAGYYQALPFSFQVNNYGGVGADDFYVYYGEQGAGTAIGGTVAPCNDTTTRPEFTAVTCTGAPIGGTKRRLRLRGEY